jgi:hypothetical protein
VVERDLGRCSYIGRPSLLFSFFVCGDNAAVCCLFNGSRAERACMKRHSVTDKPCDRCPRSCPSWLKRFLESLVGNRGLNRNSLGSVLCSSQDLSARPHWRSHSDFSPRFSEPQFGRLQGTPPVGRAYPDHQEEETHVPGTT